MRRQLLAALVALLLVFTVLLGVAYPLAVTGVAQVAFPARADGSLVERDGSVVGSTPDRPGVRRRPSTSTAPVARPATATTRCVELGAPNLGPDEPGPARRGRRARRRVPRG